MRHGIPTHTALGYRILRVPPAKEGEIIIRLNYNSGDFIRCC